MNIKNGSCIAIGNFDGIHIGHDTLIRRMIDLSHETNQNSIIITFKFIKKDLKKSRRQQSGYCCNFFDSL